MSCGLDVFVMSVAWVPMQCMEWLCLTGRACLFPLPCLSLDGPIFPQARYLSRAPALLPLVPASTPLPRPLSIGMTMPPPTPPACFHHSAAPDADDEASLSAGTLTKDTIVARFTDMFGEVGVTQLGSDDWKVSTGSGSAAGAQRWEVHAAAYLKRLESRNWVEGEDRAWVRWWCTAAACLERLSSRSWAAMAGR